MCHSRVAIFNSDCAAHPTKPALSFDAINGQDKLRRRKLVIDVTQANRKKRPTTKPEKMKPIIDSDDDSTQTERNATRLVRLAAFAPLFREPTTVFGTRHPDTGKETRDDPMILTSYQLSEVGTKFFEMTHDVGWVVREFDWSKWAWSEEGQHLISGRVALGTANCDQLTKLLTALIRRDRFCDGVLEDAFENGLLRAIAERAEVLSVREERR